MYDFLIDFLSAYSCNSIFLRKSVSAPTNLVWTLIRESMPECKVVACFLLYVYIKSKRNACWTNHWDLLFDGLVFLVLKDPIEKPSALDISGLVPQQPGTWPCRNVAKLAFNLILWLRNIFGLTLRWIISHKWLNTWKVSATEYMSQYLSCANYLQHLWIFTYLLIHNVVYLYLFLYYHCIILSLLYLRIIYLIPIYLIHLDYIWTQSITLSFYYLPFKYISVLYKVIISYISLSYPWNDCITSCPSSTVFSRFDIHSNKITHVLIVNIN
jgi:hypothetical protein